MQRKKVLLSAFACDPKTGSEPYVGWNWVLMLSRFCEVVVVTREFNRQLIESYGAVDNVRFEYFDLPIARNKDHYWKYIKPYYVFWQLCVFFKLLPICLREKFDIVHHITYNNMDVPGFLWAIPRSKFVWGPVGGGQVPPAELKSLYGKAWYKQVLRAGIKRFGKYNPIVYLALRSASLVLYANEDTKRRFASIKHPSEILLETAIHPAEPLLEIDKRKLSEVGGVFRLVWVGRIEARKGLRLALEAIKQARLRVDCYLEVVGDGPEIEDMKDLAGLMGIRSFVDFKGRVEHQEVKAIVSRAHAFLFSSVQDTSGNVVLEALNEGLPVVALNHQGVKEILSGSSAGFLVDVESYEKVVEGLAEAIVSQASNPDLYAEAAMGARALLLSRHTWSQKLSRIQQLYESVL